MVKAEILNDTYQVYYQCRLVEVQKKSHEFPATTPQDCFRRRNAPVLQSLRPCSSEATARPGKRGTRKLQDQDVLTGSRSTGSMNFSKALGTWTLSPLPVGQSRSGSKQPGKAWANAGTVPIVRSFETVPAQHRRSSTDRNNEAKQCFARRDVLAIRSEWERAEKRAGEIVYNYPYGLATLCIEGDLGAILHCLTGRYGAGGQENMETDRNAEPAASPKKRGAPEQEPISLDAIREVVRGEIGVSTATLRTEIGARMDRVETGVTAQLERTLERLQAITAQQQDQQQTVEAIQGDQQRISSRLQTLEAKVQGLQQSAAGSTADTDFGGRKPALIMGGWGDDTPAEETLRGVQQMLKDLRVDVDADQAFVPGVRRGYAILPYGPRENETAQDLRERLSGALRRVRQANIAMGTNSEGKTRYLWMQLSQSPERRRRVQLAGKCKRLCLSFGAALNQIETEWPTGTVWFKGTRVCSATTTKPAEAQEAGAGWINIKAIARGLGQPENEVDGEWGTLRAIGGNKALSSVQVFLFQEIVTDVGKFFAHNSEWKLAFGKLEGEWRGEGVAFRKHAATHTNTQVMAGGVALVLHTTLGQKWGAISAHVPHHATTGQTEALMSEWGACTAMKQRRVLLGIDANEQFTPSPHSADQQPQGHTSRGEAMLAWHQKVGLRLPPQDLASPSHFPYATVLRPRRLDYVMLKGWFSMEGGVQEVRDIARSDHEAVTLRLRATPPPPRPHKATCGARHVSIHGEDLHRFLDGEAAIPPGDRHNQISTLSQAITKPAGDTHTNCQGGGERRQAWRAIHKQLHKEHRAWKQQLNDRASQHDWSAYRQQKRNNNPGDAWIAALTDTHDWQGALRAHFKQIFAKADGGARDADLLQRRERLERRCKHTPWIPFTQDELSGVSARWKNNKCTGPDMIAHEALHILKQHPVWEGRLREMLSDALYTGALPAAVERGLTVLLPKEAQPGGWGETRPITLSSTVLKAIAQLLLRRCAYTLRPLNTLQWAAPRKQGTELILTLRKVARMARDWGGPFWIVKLDLQKAFDSVAQTSLARLVEERVGDQHPWEARLWLSLLHAREVVVAVGGEEVGVPQTNGVRQGSPDSPVLFSARVGEALLETLQHTQQQDRGGDNPLLPPPPHHGGSYMDDTYLWGENPLHLQATLDKLQSILRRHGLKINPKKTRIITNTDNPFRFKIDGQLVTPEGGDAALTVLGSPVSFAGGPQHLAAEMGSRGRKAFGKNKKILTAKTALKRRLNLHTTLVRQSALWGCETWPVQDTLLRAANTLQLQQVRAMLGGARAPGEAWTDWNTRTLRMARVHLHKNHQDRWSTHVLRMIWGLWGHVARAEQATLDMLQWRGMRWWRQQQAMPEGAGARHARRFNSSLDTERHIVTIAGAHWEQAAADRILWNSLEDRFIQAFDPPWSSGKQGQLQNLAPTRRGRQPAIRNRTRRPRGHYLRDGRA
ncbi:unnamed protein product [Symbiodinium sp. KB8]|nr:unnamed protein product [Symbiodinium sp. KB8]